MAEFQEVMRQWKRRCKHCDAEEIVGCCVNGVTCDAFRMMKDHTNFKLVEENVMKWAEENPEPVYPTWWKYMHMIGVIPDTLGDKTLGEVTIEGLIQTHIPKDIAQKLGIEPLKEAR